MDLDLNQEPVQDQSLACEGDPPGSRRLLVELGADHESIEERIRLLESVVARARHRLQQNQPPKPTLISSSTREFNGVGGNPQPKPQCDRVNSDGGIHLLAEALAMDSSPQEILSCAPASTSTSTTVLKRKPGGSAFDCNVCFSLCKDPVLTCCGHLFCWSCFYCLPNCDVYASKECPVCEGEVLETDITPIYGAAATPSDHELASSSSSHPTMAVKIPPRPRARRIDSSRARQRQQRGAQFFVPPAFANQVRIPPRPNPSPVVFLPHDLSRLLSQPTNSLASLSRTSAEHTYFDSGNSIPVNAVAVEQDFPDFIPLYPPPLGTSTIDRINDELNSMAPPNFSPSQSHTMTSVGNPASDGSNNGYEAAQPRLSSSRRRSGNDNGLNFREWRRRRDS